MSAPVFVPDVHARPCIAAIRSLGRAGYVVHAGSSSSAALGLKSSYATNTAIYPKLDSPDFIPWMRNYVVCHGIKMIIPTGGVLHALKSVFAEFKHLLPVTDDIEVLYSCFSKTDLVSKFMQADPALGLMDNHPRSLVVDLSVEIDASVLPESQSGYYIKAESSRCQSDEGAPFFAFAEDKDKALSLLCSMAENWLFALIQEACTGFQVGVSVLMDNGKALAVSCVRDCYLQPHSKGTMSLRKSCWFPEVANDAIKRLSYLKWQGCAMGEYRYDEVTGEFNLIEINFRYWQYLHLDLWAGIDFPRMQAEWFIDGKKQFQVIPKLGIICRDTWPGEVSHLVNELRRENVGVLKKFFSILLFFARFLNPKIHQDFFFPSDRFLYFRNMKRFCIEEFKIISKRIWNRGNGNEKTL